MLPELGGCDILWLRDLSGLFSEFPSRFAFLFDSVSLWESHRRSGTPPRRAWFFPRTPGHSACGLGSIGHKHGECATVPIPDRR